MQTIAQAKDSERRWLVRLIHETGEPLAYDGSESLACKLWAGDDRAVWATPSCVWKTPPDLARVTITPAHLQNVPAGLCKLRIYVGSSPIHAAEACLRVLNAPGAATAPASYCSAQDLRSLFPKIDELADRQEDQTGFAEQIGAARDWIDGSIRDAYAQERGNGEARRQAQQWLSADKLVVSAAIRRAAACHAVADILQGQLGGSEEFAKLSARLRHQARRHLAETIAEIDLDGDGAGDVFIELSAVRCRLG